MLGKVRKIYKNVVFDFSVEFFTVDEQNSQSIQESEMRKKRLEAATEEKQLILVEMRI